VDSRFNDKFLGVSLILSINHYLPGVWYLFLDLEGKHSNKIKFRTSNSLSVQEDLNEYFEVDNF
jgi:hypothetical protein